MNLPESGDITPFRTAVSPVLGTNQYAYSAVYLVRIIENDHKMSGFPFVPPGDHVVRIVNTVQP